MPMMRARILVVDDEEKIRKVIAAALGSSHDVELAADGIEGLAKARRLHPDLILLDLQMPGLHGLTVLAKLKAGSRTSTIPVIVVSVQGETESLLECQHAGAVDQVIKPFQVENLRRIVQRQLSLLGR